jgi:hypothetical protein
MDKILKAFGMKQSTYEPCLYYMQCEREGTLINLRTNNIHVDDGLVTGEQDLVDSFYQQYSLQKIKSMYS